MDNRDEEENRPEAGTPEAGSESADWTDAEPDDTYTASSAPRDDLSETSEMDFDEPPWGDSETSDELPAPEDSDSTQTPEKDWLVDTGLAAAIRPESTELESTTEDDNDEIPDEDESSWSPAGGEFAYRNKDLEDEDLEEDDLEDDNDLDEDDFEDDDLDEDDLEDDEDEGDLVDGDFEDDEDDLDQEDNDLEEDDQEDGDIDDDDFEDDEDEENGDDNNDRSNIPLTAAGALAPDAASSRSVWPMLVGLVAIVLIAVGGWGLFEERGELQARINELERSQSQAQSANTMDASVLSALETDNAALKLQLDGLYRDYELAMAELARLQEVTATTDQDANYPAGNTPATEDPDTSAASVDANAGSEAESSDQPVSSAWFVNVGAYSVLQSAENLAARLSDGGFDATIQEMSTDAGKTLFRVRVTGLGTKEEARQVARDIESNYGTGQLWVGQTAPNP